MSSIAAIILAAGGSSRMGWPKALLEIDGETFLGRLVARACEAGCDPLRVVVGDAGDAILAVHPELEPNAVRNPAPELGQLHSLRLGLATLGGEVDAAVMMLVDHPLIATDTLRALIRAYRDTASPIVLPTRGGRRGHPILFGRAVFDELSRAPLDEGARAVVRAVPDRVREVEVDDPGVLADIDTPEVYREWIGHGRSD